MTSFKDGRRVAGKDGTYAIAHTGAASNRWCVSHATSFTGCAEKEER